MPLSSLDLKKREKSGTLNVTAKQETYSRQQIGKMTDDALLSPEELDQRKIIYPGCRDYQTLNSYRELRTRLLTAANNKNFICMVSSVSQGAGTTHVAINLASSIALDQSKTALIIDCNIYAPQIDKYLKFSPSLGLTNYLEQDTDKIEDIIYPSGVPRVRVIPAGNKTINAAEHFSSEKMELFMRTVKERYPDRFIILDSPPIGLYAESQILVALCDIAVMVVGYGKAGSAQVQAGIDTIGADKLAGLVFNN